MLKEFPHQGQKMFFSPLMVVKVANRSARDSKYTKALDKTAIAVIIIV